jgi:hypothetical protein
MVLCIAAANVVCGQSPGTKTQTKPPFIDPKIVNTTTVVQLSTVPLLFGLNRIEVARLLESSRLRPKFSGPENGIAVAQDPPAGTTVKLGSVIVVTLGVLPRVVLTGPAAPAYAGNDLTFTASLVPPLPAGTQVSYDFYWGDGTPNVSTKDTVVAHRFTGPGSRVVAVTAVINERSKIGSRIVVDVVPLPPPTDTTSPPDTSGSTATVPPTDTQTTGTTHPVDTTPTTTTAQTTTVEMAPEEPVNPRQNALLLIGVIAIILLLAVVILLVRVLRKMNGTPPAQAASPLVIKGGPGSVEYEIEHPDRIRHGPTVQVRVGMRTDEGDDDA